MTNEIIDNKRKFLNVFEREKKKRDFFLISADSGDECGETYFNYGRALYKNALAQNEDLAQELDENAEDINSSLIQSYAQKLMQSGNYDNKTSALKIMNSK